MPLLLQNLHLVFRQPRKAKHSNLIGNVLPRSRRPLCLQPLSETLPHLLNPSTHRPQIILPLSEQLWIIQHTAGNPRAVGRGVGDLRSLENGQLRSDISICLRGIGSRGRDEVESSRPLAVETEVLSKGLRNTQFESLLNEVPNRPRVPDQVT